MSESRERNAPGKNTGCIGWDEYAAFYDWENAQTVQRRDVAFWNRLAAAADGPVLELGTGTGRVALPIAKSGTSLVGIDRSEAMLARARTKTSRGSSGGRLQLVRGDIRHLPFPAHHFSLVMAPYGILQSLVRERDLIATLTSVARVLRPGGRFGVDLVPDLPSWSEYRGRKTLSGIMDGGVRVSLVESVRQDRAKKLTIFQQRYQTARGRDRRECRFTLTFRTLTVPQMTRRLEKAGFHIDGVLGDYRGGPWDRRADVWLVLAGKRTRDD